MFRHIVLKKMTMKKTFSIVFSMLFVVVVLGCSSSKAVTTKSKANVQYKDDFKSASEKEETALLKKLNASGAKYSVLIFTKNYKGEKIITSNTQKKLHSGYLISNLKTGIAEEIRIDNTIDTKVFDNLSKKEIIIPAKEAQKHKYIYLMKKPGDNPPFLITYSNTLRPLE